MEQSDVTRTRSVCLKKTLNGQASNACLLLIKLNGVSAATPINKHRLKLSYSIELLTFELIEALLKELGFILDYSIQASLRRYYYQYVEDNIREKLSLNKKERTLVCHLDNNGSDKLAEYWDQYR